MRMELESLVKKVEKTFADHRTELAEIQLEDKAGKVLVSGRVLDARTQSAVLAELQAALPEAALEDQLQVLRSSNPAWTYVAVNLTGLYDQPSWLAEMLSQNTYGAAVEILIKQGEWAFVRQVDGYLGWMFHPYLSDVAPEVSSHRVCVPLMLVRTGPDTGSPVAARLPEGVQVSVCADSGDWFKIAAHPDDLPCGMPGGWVKKSDLLPIQMLPRIQEARRQAILETAKAFSGVPYLWGGTTANGIDCSGLAQLCYHVAGVTLPRDADMQKAVGHPLEFPMLPGDLLFFSSEEDRSRISHVAISLGGWQVIHSSRRRNGVAVDDVQAVPHLKDTYIGACSYFETGL